VKKLIYHSEVVKAKFAGIAGETGISEKIRLVKR
jgi:hypothetical protein